MRASTIFAALSLFAPFALASALPSAEADPQPVAVSDPEPVAISDPELAVRDDCDYNGCTGKKGVKSGLYCGYCTAVATKWNVDWVYQINGKTGSCCTFGYRKSCHAGTESCPI